MTQQPNPHEQAGALVARAKAGDEKAFATLVRLYRPRICALALHLTGSASDAEDIAQDVFLKAYRALPAFEGRSQFFTWVYRMAVNRSLNARRDRSRRDRHTVLDDPRVDRAVAVDAAGDPGKAAELRRTYARLLAALDGLSPAIRTTVVLVSLQELSYGEAAIILRCSPGTVAWRMHVARDHLRKALARPRIPTPPPLPKLSTELSALMTACGLPIVA
jgi:RNA polymerase sigma-70 factor (ECF subfamily)